MLSTLWTWLNRVGALVGILGFLFAIYAYLNCLPVRRLTFYADPASALIVKAGQTSKLLVSYEGQPIATDVVAAQIVLWNAGKLPIKPEHIREPVAIATDPSRPILESTIRASTPERENIINADLDTRDAANGRITITWDLLEQDDGFQIQLIFAGPSETRFVPSGVIEGQKHIAIFSVRQTDWFVSLVLKGMLCLVAGLVLFIPIILFFPWGRSKEIPPPRWFKTLLHTVLGITIVLALCVLLRTFVLWLERPGLMPQSLITPGLRQELLKRRTQFMQP